MHQLSHFHGITIGMFPGDHTPARFHAIHGHEEVQVNINTLEALDGHISRHYEALVLQWAEQHRDELRAAWDKASHRQKPDKIEPLD